MNKKLILVPLVLASVVGTAVFAANESPSQQTPAIGFDKAVEIAVEAYPGTVRETEYERENGRDVFEVEIKTADGVMEVTIDATSGEILEAEAEDADSDDKDD